MRPSQSVALRRERLTRLGDRLTEQTRLLSAFHRQRLTGLADRLRLLSPRQVLARGYSITRDAATGAIVRRASDTRAAQALVTVLHEGEVRSVVESAAGAKKPDALSPSML